MRYGTRFISMQIYPGQIHVVDSGGYVHCHTAAFVVGREYLNMRVKRALRGEMHLKCMSRDLTTCHRLVSSRGRSALIGQLSPARAFSARSRAAEERIRLAHSNISRTVIDSGAISEALHLTVQLSREAVNDD